MARVLTWVSGKQLTGWACSDDSRPFTKRGDYGNWELSVDRANAARRLMQQNGVRPDQISQVRGFADQMLRKPNDPQDPSNRRISLIVQYINKDEQQPENAKRAAGRFLFLRFSAIPRQRRLMTGSPRPSFRDMIVLLTAPRLSPPKASSTVPKD